MLGHGPVTRPPADIPADIDIVLVGCARAKHPVPGPARSLYTSRSFRNRRLIAQKWGEEWFILSAEHGLVLPDEWLAPYDLNLSQTDSSYRRAWGDWVVARLERVTHRAGGLRDAKVLVLAPKAYAEAVRDRLRAVGAVVLEPLAGLTQGFQAQWYSHHAAGLEPADDTDPAPELRAKSWDEGARPVENPIERTVRNAAIAAALVAYRHEHMTPDESRLGFAESKEADDLLKEDPFAFLVGVILDEGIKAERAWQGPWELRNRLGHLDPWRLQHDLPGIHEALNRPPVLHRYREIMPIAIHEAAHRVCEYYEGDTSRIWRTGSTAAEVEERLLAFRRIGPKKAAMAVELLISHFGVAMSELVGTNVAYDVHVRRVFLRSGLVDIDDRETMMAVARRLRPERPGYIDLPTWAIGRRWCRPTAPDCRSCPIAGPCRQLTHRNVSSS